jgi:hypothetical protein
LYGRKAVYIKTGNLSICRLLGNVTVNKVGRRYKNEGNERWDKEEDRSRKKRKGGVGERQRDTWEKRKARRKEKKESRKEGKGREWEKARENVLITRKVGERRRKSWKKD